MKQLSSFLILVIMYFNQQKQKRKEKKRKGKGINIKKWVFNENKNRFSCRGGRGIIYVRVLTCVINIDTNMHNIILTFLWLTYYFSLLFFIYFSSTNIMFDCPRYSSYLTLFFSHFFFSSSVICSNLLNAPSLSVLLFVKLLVTLHMNVE